MSIQPPPVAPPEAETVILRLRRHGRRLTLPVILLIALAAAAGYWIGALPEAWMNLAAAGAAILLALLLGIGPVLGWLSARATITNRRVILRRGFFVHHRSEVPLSRVREVRSRRGPLQRMFGSGNVELAVGGESSIVLRDVPGPQAVVEALQELIERSYVRDAQAPPAVDATTALPRA